MFKFTPKHSGLGDAQIQDRVAEVEQLREQVRTLRLRIVELEELASNDELVRLPNRRSFLQSLSKLIDRVCRYDEPAAMIFVDVDGLKQINDCFGHSAGDAALIKVAQLLVRSVRESDCVGRLSGDEFGILLYRTDELGAWEMALRVVERVTNSEFHADGKSLRLSVAVGVGMIKPDDTPQETIKRADEQMYRIKFSSPTKIQPPTR
jgi:diguanylate cyclase (GGDEF)-like protein